MPIYTSHKTDKQKVPTCYLINAKRVKYTLNFNSESIFDVFIFKLMLCCTLVNLI